MANRQSGWNRWRSENILLSRVERNNNYKVASMDDGLAHRLAYVAAAAAEMVQVLGRRRNGDSDLTVVVFVCWG